jgi:hypothetical protein
VAVINELRRLKGEILVDLDRADGRAFVEAFVDTEPNRLGAVSGCALRTDGRPCTLYGGVVAQPAGAGTAADEAGRWVARVASTGRRVARRVEAVIAERIDRLPEAEHRILSAARSRATTSLAKSSLADRRHGCRGSLPPEGSLARQHSPRPS